MEENNQNKEPLNKDFKVPKLRFKEFNAIWIRCVIGELCVVEMCKRIFADQTLTNGEIPFYKIGTLGGQPDVYISRDLFEKYKAKYRYPNKGEILISCSGTIGRCFQFDGSDSYFQDSNIVWLANDEHIIFNCFLYYLIYRYDWSFLNTTTIKRLFTSDINRLCIYFPAQKSEQSKIATFLNLIDAKITLTNSKIATLKKYKEGIVQKLLNSLAKSNLISLDQLCQITTGKLDANAQIDKGKYKFFTCAREDFLINTYAFDTEAILVSGNGEVGLTKYYKGKFNAYQRTYVLYDFSLNPLYLKACIDSQINNVIRKETNKGAMPYIKLSTFTKIEIPMISKEESNNIGTLMVSLDSKINCYEQIMATITKMKSFLLNNLFI